MRKGLFGVLAATCATLSAAALFSALPAFADADEPAKPRIDCSKPANKNKPACKPNHGGWMSDDEIYNGAYWMARQGQYREALALLARAANKDDPRLLNATGYATRKLGDADAALPFYARALEINPNYTLAREYLGEAYLSKGDAVSARAQLGEIEKRCGQSCTHYAKLASEIAAFETAHASGG
jgi:tetratricopeptide (TPR) repeat protein